VGQVGGKIEFTDLRDIPRMLDIEHARPKKQWWMGLREIARIMAQPEPQWDKKHIKKGD
jgi:6-phosphofructokinase 1